MISRLFGRLNSVLETVRDSIDPAVLEALAENYPADQATGYSVGDLRGWTWVKVPPQ